VEDIELGTADHQAEVFERVLIAAIRPLLEARNAVEQQVSELDRKVMKLARHDAQVRRFMTVLGVGATTS
jgi:transposase